jgi:hypothetical protein
MQLTLEPKETALLRQVLERYLGDLRMEVGKTENFSMRQELKQDEEVVKGLITRLGS